MRPIFCKLKIKKLIDQHEVTKTIIIKSKNVVRKPICFLFFHLFILELSDTLGVHLKKESTTSHDYKIK